jgi:hypothetical protein
VEALLIIKLHRVPNCPTSSSFLESVRRALGPDSVNHPTGAADGARSPPGLSHWRMSALELRIAAQRSGGGRPS